VLRWASQASIWLLSACLFNVANAYDVGPLVHGLDVATGKLGSTFTISNSTDRQLTVEVTAFELIIDSDGVRLGASADDALLIFPPAVRIAPGASQAVRFQLDPTTLGTNDQSYVLVVDQLPIKNPAQPASAEGIAVLLSFNVIVHVSATGSTVELRARLANELPNAQSDYLQLHLQNTGTANAFGQFMNVKLHATNTVMEVSADTLIAANNDLFLPPKGQRIVRIPLDDNELVEPVRVEINYAEAP